MVAMAIKIFIVQISISLQNKGDVFFAHIAKKPFVRHREQAYLLDPDPTQLV